MSGPNASPAPASTPFAELTDDEVSRRLAGETVQGPRRFRGRELAPYTKGLRDLAMKVISPDDTGILHDVTVVYLLLEAHSPIPAEKIARRMALIAATDDRANFRARVSVEFLDDLSDAEIAEIRTLVDGILSPVQAAQVQVVAPLGKKKAAGRPTRSRTKTSS